MVLVINNSFCKLQGTILPSVNDLVTEVLTYKNDIEAEKGQLFYQLKLSKRYNNKKQYHAILSKIKHLEDTEYVCLYRNNTFPTGLLNIVLEVIRALNAQFNIIDSRRKPTNSAILRWDNKPFEPRYYQKEMISEGLKAGRGVFEAAVGTGKSLVMANMIKELGVNSLIIVPSRGLSDQLYNDFVTWFGYKSVQLIDAEKVRKSKSFKPIRIVTIQSLGSLQKSGELNKLVEDIDAIHCDELHHAGASTYTNLLKDLDHVYHRYGYTGTFLRNDNKTLDMWSFISNVLYKYPAHKAMEEGFLTPMSVIVHEMNGASNQKYQIEYDNNYCGNPVLLEKIKDICITIPSKDQILILVNKKDKSGKLIHEYLNAYGIENDYISGDNKKEEISSTIEAFNDRKIKILIGSAVIAEGIDVRSTDHLLNLKGGKSEITLVQAIGRGIRAYPGKNMAYVHEFKFNNTNYLEKHFDARMEAIEENFKPRNIVYA